MHLKRSKIPRTWPIERKGSKYLVRAISSSYTLPVLVALRDMLKIAKNKKEVKNAIKDLSIKVNNKIIKDEKYPISLFDVLSVKGRNFRLIFSGKKLQFSETKENNKICKVINQKILNNKKIQINMLNGENYISDKPVKIGSSIILNFIEKKITKIIELEIGREIIFISGKHIGEKGEISEINGKNITIKSGDNKIETKLENIILVK